MYITCTLTATSASYPIDNDHRACYYNNGWVCGRAGVSPYRIAAVFYWVYLSLKVERGQRIQL